MLSGMDINKSSLKKAIIINYKGRYHLFEEISATSFIISPLFVKVQNYSVQIQHIKTNTLYNITKAYGSRTRSQKLYSACVTSITIPEQEQFYTSL